MDWIEDLEKVLPRSGDHDPEQRAAATDWSSVEQKAGYRIPQDYKHFDAHWGHGVLGKFINFFSPAARYPALSCEWGIYHLVESYRNQKTDYPEEFPLPLLPAEGSFLPFAITDNGDWLGWIAKGDSDDWTVAVIGNDVGEAELFDLPFHSFIKGMALGEITPESFPRGLKSRSLGFSLLTQ